MVLVPRIQMEKWRSDLPFSGLLYTSFSYQLDELLASREAGGKS
jgi:hypothetical protein